MADLNALIAQGYQFQAPPDPFANYAKMQQLDVGEQTNQLNRMKMQEYQRGMEEQNQLRQLYATPGIDQNSQEFSRRMAAISPTAYQAHVKSVQEGKKSAADIGLAEARTLEAGAGTAQKKQQLAKDQRDFVKASLSSLSFNPSDANITAFAEDAVLMKHLTPEQAQAKKDQLLAMPIDQRKSYLAQQGMSTADTAKLFESKPVEKTDGQTKWMEETNPRLPTFGQRMTGAPTVQMKATPGEKSTAATAASRLAQEANTPQYMVTDQGVVALPKNPKPGAITGSVVIGPSGEPLQKELKPIPANINTAIITNNQSLKSIDEAIRLIKQNPDAVGWKGYAPNKLLNESNPEGVDARAAISNIGSLKLHERSGAAVTASEFPRLAPFIPLATDDADTVVKKLQQMKTIAQGEQQGLTETYTKDQGYRPNPILNPKGAPAAVPKPSGIPTGWVLHTDAAGRKAYVSPNGKDFKEVP